ncbi:MAG: phosphoenolpyruvate carboxylase [Bacteroidetes bacterium]|jgi:phosphoenolpyruvate carboxylase|nr:phosphoenolpyruvate carboxylase [Flavobacteriaceae bacterium]MDA1209689.1 phosphoenolpyruvate carboxylase [Bacteroidota bacterium]
MKHTKEERFQKHVLSKYQIYNSIFMTLPFDSITKTGVLLPLFEELCVSGYEQGKNPTEIIHEFYQQYRPEFDEKQQINLLFSFIQYIERQVVLFDAIEEATFSIINNTEGRGTLRSIKDEAHEKNKREALKDYLKRFKVRPVLTAHPTQFYPGSVLGIITDLAKSIEKNKLDEIELLLAQLGKTPFFKKSKPSPFDEAVSLIWYLEHVFYQAAHNIYRFTKTHIFDGEQLPNELINLGFWPGGDRDGNPFVTAEITLEVAARLRRSLMKNYYKDVRKMKRRITFDHAEPLVLALEEKLAAELNPSFTVAGDRTPEFLKDLASLKEILETQHEGLFVTLVDELIEKMNLFGCYFASLDIRQDSRIHTKAIMAIAQAYPEIIPMNYPHLDAQQKIDLLGGLHGKVDVDKIKDEMGQQTLASIYAMKSIQEKNGAKACERYIISNNGSVVNVMEAFAMIRLCDWETPNCDVIPLFETIDDLKAADKVMEALYTNSEYQKHLQRRGNRQSIMLGFSDGTKDGGYLMANWAIYRAKERLTEVSRAHGITALFFDGRGGPPARGGGKTHQFYASLGNTIEHEEVQLTIQGQTISSNFGTIASCQYNLEQLISSGIANEIFSPDQANIAPEQRLILAQLADLSYSAYQDFKNHPKFLPYLEKISTLKYYAKTNIGSRPAKRGSSDQLNFSDLRAIPFVGSWSQLKQNVPGFYGVGIALEALKAQGKMTELQELYKTSAFFRTLLENSMMSLSKSYFPLTQYLKDDPEFGGFWQLIYQEYLRSKDLVLEVSGLDQLMEDSRAMRASIGVRERIVLPLLTIQQYALRSIQEIHKGEKNDRDLAIYEKMVTRSLFGNINASRNSA